MESTLKKSKKHEIVYKKLKEDIIYNRLQPDVMLPELELCETFGVSRTPIREALHRLANEGLVEIIPDKGTYVSRISLDNLIEIFEVREALEGIAARLYANRKDKERLQVLKNILNNMDINFLEGDMRKVMSNDIEFHWAIIQGAKNNRLSSILATIYDQISRIANTAVQDTEILKIALDYHKKIYDAINEENADRAEELVREHIKNTKEYHINNHYIYK